MRLLDWVQDKIEAFDPRAEARVVGNIFSAHETIGDRPVLGARPKSWLELEDKMIIDAVWDAVEIERAPSVIVALNDVTPSDLFDTILPPLDWGMATVWVADNKAGWHGGAKYLRWVRSTDDAVAAHAFFSECSDQIRIMPFMDGMPCSIHGWVFDDQTISLRPCEMRIYREDGSAKLTYCGASTNWEPSEPIRNQMCEAATKVGEHLKRTVN